MIPMKRSKERAKQRGLKILEKSGISFSTKDGVSYFTTNRATTFEFWPTTGSWLNRTTKERGISLHELVDQINRNGASTDIHQCRPIDPTPPSKPSSLAKCQEIKINVNVDGRFFSVSSKRFAVTDASQKSNILSHLLRDIEAAIEKELSIS